MRDHQRAIRGAGYAFERQAYDLTHWSKAEDTNIANHATSLLEVEYWLGREGDLVVGIRHERLPSQSWLHKSLDQYSLEFITMQRVYSYRVGRSN